MVCIDIKNAGDAIAENITVRLDRNYQFDDAIEAWASTPYEGSVASGPRVVGSGYGYELGSAVQGGEDFVIPDNLVTSGYPLGNLGPGRQIAIWCRYTWHDPSETWAPD
jgi:hypothetical protein